MSSKGRKRCNADGCRRLAKPGSKRCDRCMNIDVGRPSKLTPELQEQLCKLIETPMAATHAAAMVGIATTTYFRWMADGSDDEAPIALKEFRDAVMRAKAVATSKLLEPIWRAARGYQAEKVTNKGTTVIVEEFDWRAAAWLLQRMAPDEFGNRQSVELNQVPDDVSAMEFDEATEAAARALIAKASGYEPT